jgi:hypothetical protein
VNSRERVAATVARSIRTAMYRYDLIDKTGRSVLRKAEAGSSASIAVGRCGNVLRSGYAGHPALRLSCGSHCRSLASFRKNYLLFDVVLDKGVTTSNFFQDLGSLYNSLRLFDVLSPVGQ